MGLMVEKVKEWGWSGGESEGVGLVTEKVKGWGRHTN